MKHVPNALTILRILVTPLLLYLLYRATLAGHFWALTLFVFAAISDWLDGKLARRYAVKSRLGQYLDPMADKILVLGTFIVLAIRFPELVPWWAVLIVASRDVAVTVLRSVFERKGLSLHTSSSAKWKTAAQLTYLIAFLLTLTLTHVPGAIGRSAIGLMDSSFYFWSLLAVAAITVYTGIQYFVNRKTEDPVAHHA
ncbi:MAG: CDP-diacylglycerol--glycerol-3-phosphate 3-phosphatidyltransferase [Rhodothermales bacterium]